MAALFGLFLSASCHSRASEADLGLSMSVSGDDDGSILAHLSVTNLGPDAAGHVRLTFFGDETADLASHAEATGWTCAPQNVVNKGDLIQCACVSVAAGSVAELTFRYERNDRPVRGGSVRSFAASVVAADSSEPKDGGSPNRAVAKFEVE